MKYPVTTFELPIELTPPSKSEDGKLIPDYHSNIFNVQFDFRRFTFGDSIILSNNILPFLNNKEDLPIWIRMCLSKDDTESYEIPVSLNCENAEGVTTIVKLIPSSLLKKNSLRNP